MKTFYTHARIWRDGRFEDGTLVVEEGRIVGAAEPAAGDRVVDLAGRTVIPGLVDVHVHLREPGFPHKETVATGTAAAARGGYTTVCPMPNLNPAPDTAATLAEQLEIIRRDAAVRVVPYGCITMGQRGAGELADLEALAPDVAGFSDDGRGVQEAATMEAAMRRAAALGKPIVAHCEVNELLRGGYIHDGDYCRTHGHKGISSESEWRQVARDIELAAKTGCRYHVCHVSTRESVELVRQARARGLRVSCETAPHYLLLCDEDLREEGRFKMNPPLRSRADRAALLEGIADGTIEVIATDHAPHTAQEKAQDITKAPSGIIGLETALPLAITELVNGGCLTMKSVLKRMSTNPAAMYRLDAGYLAEGGPADIILVDTAATQVFAEYLSRSSNSPFTGRELHGVVKATICGGKVVYQRPKA